MLSYSKMKPLNHFFNCKSATAGVIDKAQCVMRVGACNTPASRMAPIVGTKGSIVEPVITHTPWWTAQGMRYEGLCI